MTRSRALVSSARRRGWTSARYSGSWLAMIQLVALSSASPAKPGCAAASTTGPAGCGDAVEVGRGTGGADGAEAVDVGVAEASGDGLAGRVGDLFDDADEQVRLLQRRRDEDGAAVEGAAELADGLVHDGVVQRVTRSEEVGAGEVVRLDVAEVEGDSVVLGGDRARAGSADVLRARWRSRSDPARASRCVRRAG